MAKIFKESTLERIMLDLSMVYNAPTLRSEEEVEEWYRCVEVGGKELILSMKDNRHLETLPLEFFSTFLESSSLSAIGRKHKHHSKQQ